MTTQPIICCAMATVDIVDRLGYPIASEQLPEGKNLKFVRTRREKRIVDPGVVPEVPADPNWFLGSGCCCISDTRCFVSAMEINANIAGQGLVQVEIADHQIASVRKVGSIDPESPFLSPGFVDIQINGFAGVDFSDPQLEPEQAVIVLSDIWKTGVTSFCPTLITNTLDRLERNLRVLEKARQLDNRFSQSVPGYHLEGPCLSPASAYGTHNRSLMRRPDWNEFLRLQEAAGGNIVIVTLAPELPGACEFIRCARAAGLIVAIGHTDAGPEDIHKAIEAGAEL